MTEVLGTAIAIKTTAGNVVINSTKLPSAGEVLTAISPTVAEWVLPPVRTWKYHSVGIQSNDIGAVNFTVPNNVTLISLQATFATASIYPSRIDLLKNGIIFKSSLILANSLESSILYFKEQLIINDTLSVNINAAGGQNLTVTLSYR